MDMVFECPKCESVLSPSVKVILIARCRKTQGLMLLSPRFGDYNFFCDDKLNGVIKDGDNVEFACPVCHESLTSAGAEGFAELRVKDRDTPGSKYRRVRFSCVCNEHATFVYDEESVKKFGNDVERFYDSMSIDGPWGW